MLRASYQKQWLVAATCALALSGCSFLQTFAPKAGDDTDVIDRQQHLTVDDFRNLNKLDKLPKSDEEPKVSASLGAPPLPDLAQVLAAPRPPKVANTKLVTLAVTEDVPLRDVLFELGRLSNVDIEVGSGLDKSGINLRATDQPFNEVIERIADLGGLRYSVKGKSIRVEKDNAYIKNYSIDFLNVVRSSSSTYSLDTSILGGGSGSSSGGGSSSSGSSSGGGGEESGGGSGTGVGSVGTSGSSSKIDTKAESDLWTAMEASVKEILNQTGGAAPTAADPDTVVPNPDGSVTSGTSGPSAVVINRQAGVLSVRATDKQHQMIQRFLTLMGRNASAQVLIEAKIVEVSLSDQFLSGVDWNSILGDARRHYVGLGTYIPGAITGGPSVGTGSSFSAGIDHGQLEAVIEATQRFGTTRTLSSPRLSAINNQQAVLTFARNEVFFDCQVPQGSSTTTNTGGTTVTGSSVTCTTNSVPIGIVLNILPSINSDTQEVTLNVRPTLTRQVDQVENPGVAIAAQAVGLSLRGFVPVIEVRELDSVMKVKSGGVMIIGGLMEDASRNQFNGIPGANEIPIFGNLFKSRSEDGFKRELIVLIKATIVNPDGSASAVDRAVYEKYTTDPRPFFPQ